MNIRRLRGIFYLPMLLCAFTSEEQKKPVPKGALIDVRATSDLDGTIGQGGIDTRVQGGTLYRPHLALCNSAVLQSVSDWATANKLATIKNEQRQDGLTVQMVSDKTPGFFELLYRFDSKGKLAQVTLIFYKTDGTPVMPELMHTVDQSRLGQLQVDLGKAITCDSN